MAPPAQAANWLLIDATESPTAPAIGAYGALRVEYLASHDTPLLAGAWTGQPDQFNRFAPRFDSGRVLQLAALTAGLHGRLDAGRLNYRLAVVAGENPIVRGLTGSYGSPLRLTDASLTFSAGSIGSSTTSWTYRLRRSSNR